MNNVYISFSTPTLGGKYFIAAFSDGVSIRGGQRLKNIEFSVTGAVNVTMSPTMQRIDNLLILINGTEQETFDPGMTMIYRFGDYSDLVDYFYETSVTMKEWNGTEKDVVFMGSTLVPQPLSPNGIPMIVPIQLMERT